MRSGGIFDLAKTTRRMKELEEELNSPEIWKDQEKADALSRELRTIRSRVKPMSS